MSFETEWLFATGPLTATPQGVFSKMQDRRAAEDLLLLERWEICPLHGSAAALRVIQIRRANPELVKAIRRELTGNPAPEDIENRVDDLSHRPSAVASSWRRRWQKGLQDCPLDVGQVTSIA